MPMYRNGRWPVAFRDNSCVLFAPNARERERANLRIPYTLEPSLRMELEHVLCHWEIQVASCVPGARFYRFRRSTSLVPNFSAHIGAVELYCFMRQVNTCETGSTFSWPVPSTWAASLVEKSVGNRELEINLRMY